jgi:cell filamentation protein
MSDEGYEVFDDPYCYRATFALKNRAGLKDPKRLQAFELEMSSLRADEPLPDGRFGPAHYRAAHKHLFGESIPGRDATERCELRRAATA